MNNTICLDASYSTTRIIVKEKPNIVNNTQDKFETVLLLPEGGERQGEGGLRAKGYFKQSYESKPLISIITVVYNGKKYLEETIHSVINQTYDNVEYIIIDGGSTDGTLDIIRKYENQIDYWISERDHGIYDAMNKGITLVSGEWINFMNAGDTFINDNIFNELVLNKLLEQNVETIVTGFVKIVNIHGKWLGYRHPYQIVSNCNFLKDNCIAHQATFVSLNIHKKIGYFSTSYQIQGDYDYWLRAKKLNISFRHIKKDIALFIDNGVSSNRALYPQATRERYDSLLKNGYLNTLNYYLFQWNDLVLFWLKTFIRAFIGHRIANTISTKKMLKIQTKENQNNKIIYDLSIAGATKAGVYVFASNLYHAATKIDNSKIIPFNNPFSTYQKKGFIRKIHSILRLLYAESIIFKGQKNDFFFFPAPEVPFSVILLNRRYGVTIHDLYAWKNPNNTTFFARLNLKRLPYLIKNAEIIFTVSEFSKREIQETFLIQEEKIIVIPNGLNVFLTDKQHYRKLPSALEGIPYLLNVGSLEPRKNIPFLIEIFESLKDTIAPQLKNLKLVLTGGESWNVAIIIEKILTSKYKNDIVILGNVEDELLPVLYHTANVMVFPSFSEGFGIPVIEALSQGTPVVINNNSALADFKAYGATIIDSFELGEWVQTIHGILTNGTRIDHEKIQTKFSWTSSATTFIKSIPGIM